MPDMTLLARLSTRRQLQVLSSAGPLAQTTVHVVVRTMSTTPVPQEQHAAAFWEARWSLTLLGRLVFPPVSTYHTHDHSDCEKGFAIKSLMFANGACFAAVTEIGLMTADPTPCSKTCRPEIARLFLEDVLPVRAGRVGHWEGGSWDNDTRTWVDTTGISGNAFAIRGGSGLTALQDFLNGYTVMSGDVQDALRIPSTKLVNNANFTLFHVSRYNDSASGNGLTGSCGRIMTTGPSNWLSGFWGCRQGLAFHSTGFLRDLDWVNTTSTSGGFRWTISADQTNTYRADGIARGTAPYGSRAPGNELAINVGWAGYEYTKWLVAEVLAYEKKLSLSELMVTEEWLACKYDLALQRCFHTLEPQDPPPPAPPPLPPNPPVPPPSPLSPPTPGEGSLCYDDLQIQGSLIETDDGDISVGTMPKPLSECIHLCRQRSACHFLIYSRPSTTKSTCSILMNPLK